MNAPSFPAILDRHFKMNQDYLLDLVHDLFDQESKLELVPNYYEVVQEKEITLKMRTKLIEWMIQLSDEIKLGYKTKQMAVMIIDIILSKLKIHKKYLQLLGITAIFITVKSEESFIYTLTHACEHCANAYSKEEVSTMEMLILKTLKWKLQYPVPGEIARRLVQLTNSELNVNLFKFYKKLDNFVDLAISEFDSSMFSPTCIAAAAVMCSFENSLVHIGKWRELMMEHFHLDFEGKIDFLYQSIIQKLIKFYPDYFSFPNPEDFQQLTMGYASTQNAETHQHNNENGLNINYLNPQEGYAENNNQQVDNGNPQFGQFENGLCHEQLQGFVNEGTGVPTVVGRMDEEGY